MDFESHCKASEALFGQRFEEVHHWLDEFAQKPGIGMKHRKFRHHLEGVAEAGALFGTDGGRAALQVIFIQILARKISATGQARYAYQTDRYR